MSNDQLFLLSIVVLKTSRPDSTLIFGHLRVVSQIGKKFDPKKSAKGKKKNVNFIRVKFFPFFDMNLKRKFFMDLVSNCFLVSPWYRNNIIRDLSLEYYFI